MILLAGARWGWEEVRKSESTDSELVYDWQRRSFVLRGRPRAVMGAYASIVFIAIRFPFGRAASHSPLLLADIAPSHLTTPSHFRPQREGDVDGRLGTHFASHTSLSGHL